MKNTHTIATIAALALSAVSCTTQGPPTMVSYIPTRVSTNTNDSQKESLSRSWSAATDTVGKATSDLRKPTELTASRLQASFGNSDEETRQNVLRTLSKMETDARHGNYKLTYVPVFPQKVVNHFTKSPGEKITAIAAMDGEKEIWIGKAFFSLNEQARQTTLTHELSHRAADTEDFAYLRGNLYMVGASQANPSKAQLLRNADTIAAFVRKYR